MPQVTISPAARDDTDQIAMWIAEGSLQAGLSFLDAVSTTLRMLSDMPRLGQERHDLRHERLTGLRSIQIEGFEKWLVFYRVTHDGVEVIRILHGARDLPALLSDDP